MVKENIKILIIPDVHGRDFWKTPVQETLENTNAKIIFLGDYLDPYPYEWESGKKYINYKEHAIENFLEIISLKEKHPERITLLLGNHDCGYCVNRDICDCRTDYRNSKKISQIFEEYRDLFQLADEITIKDCHIIFSHAGIIRGWTNFNFKDVNLTDDNIVPFLNNMWLASDEENLSSLGQYDLYRGWSGYDYGSVVWSDIRNTEKQTKENMFGDYQIVGHTQLEKDPILLKYVADVDCRQAIVLDDELNLSTYDDSFMKTIPPQE